MELFLIGVLIMIAFAFLVITLRDALIEGHNANSMNNDKKVLMKLVYMKILHLLKI